MATAPPPAIITPPREPIVDPRTGIISRAWFLFFQQLQRNTSGSGDVAVVVVGAVTGSSPNGRELEFVDPLVATDTGPGGTLSVDLRDTPVVPGPYGSAAKTVSFTVTRRGRIVTAAEYNLTTSNITEGSKLFYTDARVRAAISGTAPIAFSGAGVISLNDTAVTPGAYGDAAHVGTFTVDAKGRLTAAASVAITFPGTTGFSGTVAPPLSLTFVDGLCVAAT